MQVPYLIVRTMISQFCASDMDDFSLKVIQVWYGVLDWSLAVAKAALSSAAETPQWLLTPGSSMVQDTPCNQHISVAFMVGVMSQEANVTIDNAMPFLVIQHFPRMPFEQYEITELWR